MLPKANRYAFVVPLLFILALSYWRYTYILNPNFQGDPVLLDYRYYIHSLGANSMLNIRSILIYWVFFFLGNVLFFLVLFTSKEKVKAIIFFYLIISSVSGALFFIQIFIYASPAIYGLAATMKNFMLSPIFTGVGYIIVEYFEWVVKK